MKSGDNSGNNSSGDDIYLSLGQSESNSSTCSSDHRTPQQSPRENDDNEMNQIHAQVTDVVIPDLDSSEISLSQPPENKHQWTVIIGHHSNPPRENRHSIESSVRNR